MSARGFAVGSLLAALGWLAGGALAGCSKQSDSERAASAAAPSSAPSARSAAPSVTAPAPAPAFKPLSRPGCRALRVQGDAKVSGVPLSSGAEVDGSDWVSLASGASLTLKHSRSGRELTLSGPALFRACRRGTEQVLLARGKVAAGSGMGVRPGAEVLVATPVALVRYADADFSLELEAGKLRVAVRSGQVEVEPVAKGSSAAQRALRARQSLVLPLGKPDISGLMERCKLAAQAAEAAARRVGDHDDPEPLGERARDHVRARRAARAACTVVAAATGLAADADRAGLWAEAVRWEGLWETIPRRDGTQAPEK